MIGQRWVSFAGCIMVAALGATAAELHYPVKDGTIVDGGIYGVFDGLADDADWVFNQSSYEGAISRTTKTLPTSLEHRVVWEYNLAGTTAPVTAVLHVTIRGAPVFPRPDASVHVYAYPADLQETLSDFQAPAIGLVGVLTVPPFQPPTVYEVDVSDHVNARLADGIPMVAFRFQIDPLTPNDAEQAFIDALDAEQHSKPYLSIETGSSIPGDIDGDGDVDRDDYLGFGDCMQGPNRPVITTCLVYDFDDDTDVDLEDFGLFQTYFGTVATPP